MEGRETGGGGEDMDTIKALTAKLPSTAETKNNRTVPENRQHNPWQTRQCQNGANGKKPSLEAKMKRKRSPKSKDAESWRTD